MILNNDIGQIIKTTATTSKAFTMNNSAQAFSILSSSLYSNKIKAIIRELSSNAYDSHVEAGKADVPFDIHLPNYINCYFSIRDYGVGLSDKEVNEIYTVYFSSTKTDSNDFIGGFGLGSKTPFCYTSNFSITAIKDGDKNIYSAFLNDEGFPSISHLTNESTDEGNGVEIKFGCEQNDAHKFQISCASNFKYYKVKPNMSDPSFEFAAQKYIDQDVFDNCDIVLGQEHRNSGTNNAIIGNVSYPIEVATLSNHGAVHNSRLDIVFDVGDLDVHVSREALSYTKATVAKIEEKYRQINDYLNVYVAKKLKIRNKWERLLIINQLKKNNLFKNLPSIAKNSDLVDVVGKFHGSRRSELAANASRFNVCCKTIVKRADFINIADIKFVINPKCKGLKARIENSKYSCTRSSLYILQPISKTEPFQIDAFLKYIQSPPKSFILNEEDLPANVSRKTDYSEVIRGRHLQMQRSKYWARPSGGVIWTLYKSFNASDEELYCIIDGTTGKTVDGNIDPKILFKDIPPLSSCDKFRKTIYITQKQFGQLGPNSKWKDSFTELKKHILAKITKKDIIMSKIKTNSHVYRDLREFVDISDSQINKLINFKTTVEDGYIGMVETLGLFDTANNTKEITDFQKEYDDLRNKYKIFEYLSLPSKYSTDEVSDCKKEIVKILNLIDSEV